MNHVEGHELSRWKFSLLHNIINVYELNIELDKGDTEYALC